MMVNGVEVRVKSSTLSVLSDILTPNGVFNTEWEQVPANGSKSLQIIARAPHARVREEGLPGPCEEGARGSASIKGPARVREGLLSGLVRVLKGQLGPCEAVHEGHYSAGHQGLARVRKGQPVALARVRKGQPGPCEGAQGSHHTRRHLHHGTHHNPASHYSPPPWLPRPHVILTTTCYCPTLYAPPPL